MNGCSDDEPNDAGSGGGGSGGGGNTVAQDRLPELRAEAPPPCRLWCDERVARCGKDEASCLSTCTWSFDEIPESCGPSASKLMECEAEIDPCGEGGEETCLTEAAIHSVCLETGDPSGCGRTPQYDERCIELEQLPRMIRCTAAVDPPSGCVQPELTMRVDDDDPRTLLYYCCPEP
ncbi:hypothetical protein WME90_07955 [Sorangium sp. So ce375]|uniref:hypothetical protein n=1 Tax=Sorangium sp. So ce375 TaxID=3133306 RepID=UPI003F5C884D